MGGGGGNEVGPVTVEESKNKIDDQLTKKVHRCQPRHRLQGKKRRAITLLFYFYMLYSAQIHQVGINTI